MRTRALRYDAPGEILLEEGEIVDPAPGDALVRMRACGICGTDLHIYEHGWHATPGMRLGHEFSAEVVAAPGVDGVSAGDRVVVNPTLSCGHCPACRANQQHMCHERRGVIGLTVDGAFADYVLVPGARLGLELLAVPDGVSDEAAALTEPLAVGLHAVNLAGAQPGQHVVVYGAGTIGLCATRWLAAAAAHPIVVDPIALRREVALAQGATVALDPGADGYADELAAALAPAAWAGRADVVIDCAGAPGLLDEALSVVSPGGTLGLAAVGMGEYALSANRVMLKEVAVRGAMSYNAPEFERALAHVAEHADDVLSLVSHRFPLTDVLAAFDAQRDREGSVKVMVTGD
jgi:threonine dehydrogenase-like Zn-dependent dehydrogenase